MKRTLDEMVTIALYGRLTDANVEHARHVVGQLGGVTGVLAADAGALVAHGVSARDAERWVAFVSVARQPIPAEGFVIHDATDVHRLVGPTLKRAIDEHLVVLCLDRRHRVVAQVIGSTGSASFTVVDPSQIFRIAVVHRAASIVLVHNHPSGDPTPSAEDRDVTKRVAFAGQLIGIPVLDHVIIGGDRFCSLAEQGDVPYANDAAPPWAA